MKIKGQKFLVWSPKMKAEAVKDLLKEKVEEGEIWLKPLLINFREKEENNFAFCIKCGLGKKCVDYSVYSDFEDIPFMVFYLETIQPHIGNDDDRLTFIYRLKLNSGRKWEDEFNLEFGIDISKKELEKD